MTYVIRLLTLFYSYLRYLLKFRTRLKKIKSILMNYFYNNYVMENVPSTAIPQEGKDFISFNNEKFIILGIGSLGSGGAERQWANLAIALKKSGKIPLLVIMQNTQFASEWILRDLYDNEIDILSLSDLRDRHKYLNLSFPAETIRINLKSTICYSELYDTLTDDLIFLYAVYILNKIKYNLVISALDHSNIYFGIANLLTNKSKHIISFRSLSPAHYPKVSIPSKQGNILKDLYSQLVKSKSVFLTSNSVHALESYLEYFCLMTNLEPTNARIIPNETYISDISLRIVEKKVLSCCSKFHFLGFMRLSYEKNPLGWLESASWSFQNIECNLHFIFGGSGPLLEPVLEKLQEMRKLGVDIDFIESPHPLAFFKLKGALIVSSVSEGHSNIIEEAKYFSLPVFQLFNLDNMKFAQSPKPKLDLKNFILSVDAKTTHENNMLIRKNRFLFKKIVDSYLAILD